MKAGQASVQDGSVTDSCPMLLRILVRGVAGDLSFDRCCLQGFAGDPFWACVWDGALPTAYL